MESHEKENNFRAAIDNAAFEMSEGKPISTNISL